ncbi:MAG: glycosyltransferase family 4 protein [Candidatus Nanopelagicales bacterium]|jgi:glycosyltransferase involved in cell wall biosynthesis
MHIEFLFVHSSDELYGADRVLGYILDSLTSEERIRTRVWLPSDLEHGAFPLCERIEAQGVRVDHVPLPILRRANLNPAGLSDLGRRSVAFRQHCARLNPGTVYGTTSATLPALAALTGTPSRVLLHNQEVWKPREAHVLGRLARNVDRVIAISRATRDSMPAELQKRTAVVANTTPDPFEASDFRSLELVPPQPLRFLAAGRWTANKGFDVLIEAWNQAPSGQLVIVGGPPPSGGSLDIEQLVDASPVRDSITLVREVDSIVPLLAESHVVVMPSTWDEPFGLVALEGMAAGRPVIASQVGGLAQFVNSEVGWLVPPSDPVALAAALRSVSHDVVMAKGARARQEYLDKFSPERFRGAWREAMGLP